MALTPEQRAARMAELKAAREKKYFEAQAESKAAAAELTPELPKADAYVYSYAWRQDVGAPTGEYKLIKSPLSRKILFGELKDGGRVFVRVENDQLVFEVKNLGDGLSKLEKRALKQHKNLS